MSTTVNRSIRITMLDDLIYEQVFSAAEVASSVAEIERVNLSSGANTITCPTGAISVTIILPAANTETITLKGITGDTGVALHRTDPTSIGLNTVTSFVLTAGAAITGVLLIWE